MDPRLLNYYNNELGYVRELMQEFAEQHPKIADRLGINGIDVADPYVERLLQGFSMLTANIQLKMDEQFPQFSHRFLEILHPAYLAPTPSMSIVQFSPRKSEGVLADGFLIPRDSSLVANKAPGESTACEFRTVHEVTLWPVEIVTVSCTGAPDDLGLKNGDFDRPIKGAIRIRLKMTKGLLNQSGLEQLTFHLPPPDDIASTLYEHIFEHALSVVGCEPQRPMAWRELMPPSSIVGEGFDASQAMVPFDSRTFDGYRLLYEYFSFPSRFYFFTLTGLQNCLSKAQGDTLDLTILLDCSVSDLEKRVDKTALALFCTPTINLFPKKTSFTDFQAVRNENCVTIDANKPFDFEIYSISSVFGQEPGEKKEKELASVLTATRDSSNLDTTYYAIRRQVNLVPDSALHHRTRTDYVGSEVFVSLVDEARRPCQHEFKGLSVTAVCSNRDMALSIPRQEQTDFQMKGSAPLESIKLLRGPTMPKRSIAEGSQAWRVLNHLQFNHLTLIDANDEDGPQALREMLKVYEGIADHVLKKQIEAIRHCHIKQVARRLPVKMSALGYAVGTSIHITVDENLFDGTSPYLLGAILERLFPRHVGQNSFTETVLHSMQRGEIAHWKPRMGQRPIV